mgnify:CR=1 FL=1
MQLKEEQVDALLYDLCVAYGFCLSESARQRFRAAHASDAQAFALEVFRAEGLSPAEVSEVFFQKVVGRIEQAFVSALAEVKSGFPTREA